MKYLKLYEAHQSKKQIEKICRQLELVKFRINPDLTVDVDGDVGILRFFYEEYGFKKLRLPPIKFGHITGVFECSSCELTSLEGAPHRVDGYFDCANNQLTSLKGGPLHVGNHYNCRSNALTSLEGAPNFVAGDFDCSKNPIESLEMSPEIINGDFNIIDTYVKSFKGATKIIGGEFYFDNSFFVLVKNKESFRWDMTDFPQKINNKPADEWLIDNFIVGSDNYSYNHPLRGQYAELIDFDLSTAPVWVMTPKFLNHIRQNYPDLFQEIKQKQSKENQWGTDLQADAGEYGL